MPDPARRLLSADSGSPDSVSLVVPPNGKALPLSSRPGVDKNHAMKTAKVSTLLEGCLFPEGVTLCRRVAEWAVMWSVYYLWNVPGVTDGDR
jgi:hypothetical protein